VAKVPRFVSNQEDISKRILHTVLWLAWILFLSCAYRMYSWIARRYAGITDLDRVAKWPRRGALTLSFIGTSCLFIAVGSLFADYYIGYLGFLAALLCYSTSLSILIKHYQGPLLTRTHAFGWLSSTFTYLRGVVERLLEVIRHGNP